MDNVFLKYNNTTYVKLFSSILRPLFIVLSYFTLHYLWLFSVFLANFSYFTLGYFRLF
jgi:hypothetical protein